MLLTSFHDNRMTLAGLSSSGYTIRASRSTSQGCREDQTGQHIQKDPRTRPGIPQGAPLTTMTHHLYFTTHDYLSKSLALNVNHEILAFGHGGPYCHDLKKDHRLSITQRKVATLSSLLSHRKLKAQDFMFLCLGGKYCELFPDGIFQCQTSGSL